jgi:hypothetical protein
MATLVNTPDLVIAVSKVRSPFGEPSGRMAQLRPECRTVTGVPEAAAQSRETGRAAGAQGKLGRKEKAPVS